MLLFCVASALSQFSAVYPPIPSRQAKVHSNNTGLLLPCPRRCSQSRQRQLSRHSNFTSLSLASCIQPLFPILHGCSFLHHWLPLPSTNKGSWLSQQRSLYHTDCSSALSLMQSLVTFPTDKRLCTLLPFSKSKAAIKSCNVHFLFSIHAAPLLTILSVCTFLSSRKED